jgi:hypothetical protein
MMKFVGVIFAIAIIIAGVYMFFFTPGQPEQHPLRMLSNRTDRVDTGLS